jgi:hypothetical protein
LAQPKVPVFKRVYLEEIPDERGNFMKENKIDRFLKISLKFSLKHFTHLKDIVI